MKIIKKIMFALFLGSVAFAGTGCSAIGYGIGAAADSNGVKNFGVPPEQNSPLQIHEYSRIQILLKNGQMRDGEFVMYMEEKVGEEYLTSIVWKDNENRQQVITPMTDIEQVITLKSASGKWKSLEEAASIRKNSRIEIYLKSGQTQKGQFLLLLEQEEGDENVAFIVWYDAASKQQMSTKVEDIAYISNRSPELKMVGLGIGGFVDTIILVKIFLTTSDNLIDAFFDGLFDF